MIAAVTGSTVLPSSPVVLVIDDWSFVSVRDVFRAVSTCHCSLASAGVRFRSELGGGCILCCWFTDEASFQGSFKLQQRDSFQVVYVLREVVEQPDPPAVEGLLSCLKISWSFYQVER